MYDVALLTLGDRGACGSGPRVPVLACADALRAAGARVETVTATSDEEIDAVLARLDAPARADGLSWPDPDGKVRLVVATAADGQLRAVLRRMVRRYAPPPSRRPAELPASRTVPDLPPLAVLPLDPAGVRAAGPDPAAGLPARDLAAQLGLPRQPAAVAAAVLSDRVRRLDLLRTEGSVTLDGALLGGVDDSGRAVGWPAVVEVDDTLLSAGDEPLLACLVANAGGYARPDGLPLVAAADPTDGVVEVAVALGVTSRGRWRRRRVRVEVRRARGRAVAITPTGDGVAYLDDGVAGTLSRKRSWWTEPSAWAVYVGQRPV